MLTRLRVENFKSWAKADLELGRITGLFGTNSSGKTSLIQFLLMLKQTREATDRAVALELNGDYVELGTFRDVVHGHDLGRSISFHLAFARDDEDREIVLIDPDKRRTDRLAGGREFSLSAKVAAVQGPPRAGDLSYTVGGTRFSLVPKKGDPRENDLAVTGAASGFSFRRNPGRPWPLPGPVKTYAFPDQARTYYQNAGFLADLEAAFEFELDRVFYLGPLREYPKRDYLWARSRPTDVGRRGEKSIDAILAATDGKRVLNLQPKARNKSFQEMVAYWLREMGLISQFRVEEIALGSNRWQAKVRTAKDGTEVLLTDVGFGVSQVLPVVTLLWYVPEGSTVILEQPEIHLHPLAQAHLADLIISVAQRRRVQVILESHSEHLLLRLQRRIAEGRSASDEVRLYFCEAQSGISSARRLDVDLFGNIENWPRHFMGDAFGETLAAEKARLRRMQAAE